MESMSLQAASLDAAQEEVETRMDFWVEEIRKVVASNNVTIPPHCDMFIARCFRVKDHDVGNTVKLLVNFFKMMRSSDMEDLFQKFVPSSLSKVYESGIITPFLRRSHKPLVIWVRAAPWKVDESDFDDLLASVIVLFTYAIGKSSELHRSGVTFILDCRDWTLKQLRSLKMRRVKLVVKMMQNSCPGKVKGIHLVHHPKVVAFLIAILKPVMKSKLIDRIHFHGSDHSSLHQHVDQSTLPELLGGHPETKSVDEDLIKELIQQDKYCKDLVKFGFSSF